MAKRRGGYSDASSQYQRGRRTREAEIGSKALAAQDQENGANGRNRAATVTGRARAAQNKRENN